MDATGAGDQYAAGVLYGITHGLSLQELAELGNLCAREAILYIRTAPGGEPARAGRGGGAEGRGGGGGVGEALSCGVMMCSAPFLASSVTHSQQKPTTPVAPAAVAAKAGYQLSA